jgi:hypothetical protein
MKVICSYCRKKLEDKEPLESDVLSHGMCPECMEHFSRQWGGQSLGAYLDQFEVPVLVVDHSCRIVAANQEMADMIGKGERDVFGLLGGEAVECVYSRFDDGCGNSIHCRTCTVRNSVLHTIETGESLHRVECYVDLDTGRTPFFVSTVKLEKSVQVLFEPAEILLEESMKGTIFR